VKQTGDIREAAGAPDVPETGGGKQNLPPRQDASPSGTGGGKRRSGFFARVNGPSRAIALAVALVLLALFGRDMFTSWQLQSEIGDLERRKKALLDSLAADSILLRRLDDPEFLEKYARENFLMRREGETVYIVDE
jgi:cell division protein FtsB